MTMPMVVAAVKRRRFLRLLSQRPSATYSTLTSSAASFATNSNVTLTFTAKDGNNVAIEGYTPTVSAGTE